MLLPIPPSAGVLRAVLSAQLRVQPMLLGSRLAGCLVACWGVSVRVFLWAGGWGRVHQGLKHDERTESSLFFPLG